MRRIVFVGLMALLAIWGLVGCSGEGSNSAIVDEGSAKLVISWPDDQARASGGLSGLVNWAQQVAVNVTDKLGNLHTCNVTRPVGGGQSVVMLNGIPCGPVVINAQAYPNNGSTVIVGSQGVGVITNSGPLHASVIITANGVSVSTNGGSSGNGGAPVSGGTTGCQVLYASWQMADANGLICLPITLTSSTDPAVFSYAPAPTSGWWSTPNINTVNYSTTTGASGLNMAYYKYFRTLVEITGASGQAVYLTATTEDVARVYANGADTGLTMQGTGSKVNIGPYLTSGAAVEVKLLVADTTGTLTLKDVRITDATGAPATYDASL